MNLTRLAKAEGVALRRFTFPPEWFGITPALPRRVARLAHNCFPLLPAGCRGTRLCHRTWERRRQCGTGTESRTGRGRWEGRAPRRLGPVGTHPAAGHELHPDLTNQRKGSEAARELGEEEETFSKGEQKVASRAWPQNCCLQAVGLGPPTPPAAPTWQCPGLERAAGSSLACPPLPLPCPAKGFGERRTGKRCARGRRPSSGRPTSPRLGCGFGAVRGEPARRCPVSGARRSATRQRQDGLGTGRPRGSVHSRRDGRGRGRGREALPARLAL